MKSSSFEQSLSALMDGQADDLELQRILQQTEDPQVRACWQRMQLARSVMRQEESVVQADLSRRISQALAAEQAPASKQPRRSLGWSRLAVAASVTLAVLVGTKLMLGQQPAMQQPTMASSETQFNAPVALSNPVVLASYAAPSQQQQAARAQSDSQHWYNEQLPWYLRQHSSFTGDLASKGAPEPALAWHWQLGWLPEGFAPLQQEAKNLQAGQKQVSTRTYSDGQDQFSVFVEELADQEVVSASIEMGPTVGVSRRLETGQGVFMLTVLGEIPAATVQQLVQSIELYDGE